MHHVSTIYIFKNIVPLRNHWMITLNIFHRVQKTFSNYFFKAPGSLDSPLIHSPWSSKGTCARFQKTYPPQGIANIEQLADVHVVDAMLKNVFRKNKFPGPFQKVKYFTKNWFWPNENASKWSEKGYFSNFWGFLLILDPQQSRNRHFLFSKTV